MNEVTRVNQELKKYAMDLKLKTPSKWARNHLTKCIGIINKALADEEQVWIYSDSLPKRDN